MRCNNKGQMAGYEFMIILFFAALSVGEGFIIWHLLKSQNADNSFFERGSNPVVEHFEPNVHPLCGIIFDINKKDKNERTSNSQANSIK